MRSNRRTIFSLFVVLVLSGSVFASVYAVCTVEKDRQIVSTGMTIGINSYTNPVFDITYDDLADAGYTYGDTFDVTVEGVTIHNAILSEGFMGTFMFDTYLNVEKTGYLGAGAMWDNILPRDLGNDVTITYTGHNDNYYKLDEFLVKYTDDRSDYSDDATFANFYAVTGGDIKEGKLYRSFSPFTATTSRSAYVNELAENYGIAYDVALSYTEQNMTKFKESSDEGYCYDLIRDTKNKNYTAANITYHYSIMKAPSMNRVETVLTYFHSSLQ